MYVGIKISATDSSTALQNATIVANALIGKFDTNVAVPLVLILYTDDVVLNIKQHSLVLKSLQLVCKNT